MLCKADLRRLLRERSATWSAVEQAQWSAAIRTRCLQLPQVQRARSVFCYISLPGAGEPDTHELIRTFLAAGQVVLVPTIPARGQPMQAVPITRLEDCAPTARSMGIPVPPPEVSPLTADPDIAIIPGVAFTERGERLGRGAGFYDRYLAEHPGVLTFALAFTAQLVPQLPTEAHDQRVRYILTPDATLDCCTE